jgi:hypothetical protein
MPNTEDADLVVPLSKLINSLEGSLSVLKTNKKGSDEFERGRLQGWMQVHDYLLSICRAFAKEERRAVPAVLAEELISPCPT